MREIFKQLAYGRSQTAFSEGGLPIGASLEDLGKGLRSQVGTMFSTGAKGVRYMEMAEGYVLKTALDENNEVIGYQFVKLGKMLEDIRHGVDPERLLTRRTSASMAASTARQSISTRVKNNSAGYTEHSSQASPMGGSRESDKEDNLHG